MTLRRLIAELATLKPTVIWENGFTELFLSGKYLDSKPCEATVAQMQEACTAWSPVYLDFEVLCNGYTIRYSAPA